MVANTSGTFGTAHLGESTAQMHLPMAKPVRTKDPSYEQQGTQRNHGDMNLESKTAAGKLTSVKLK